MTEQIQNTQAHGTSQVESKKSREKQTRKRSLYLFPSYDFNIARTIAETIETRGAGTMTEEVLAMSLSLSAKSSGFQLKSLAARQFGLVTKQGDKLATTPLAKAILKSTSEEEKRKALVESFLKLPLFQAVASRFKGQSLPESATFRNILEREFQVEHNRVSDAERLFMDSARGTGVLVRKGDLTYISVDTTTTDALLKGESQLVQENTPNPSQQNLAGAKPRGQTGNPFVQPQIGMLPGIAEKDLLLLSEDDFNNFWMAFGKMLRARTKSSKEDIKSEEADQQS